MPVMWQRSTLLGSLEIDILAPHGALHYRYQNGKVCCCAPQQGIEHGLPSLRPWTLVPALYRPCICVYTYVSHNIYYRCRQHIYIYIYICIYIDHLHGAVTLEIDADAVHDLLGTEGTSWTFTGFTQKRGICTNSYVGYKCKNIIFDYFFCWVPKFGWRRLEYQGVTATRI